MAAFQPLAYFPDGGYWPRLTSAATTIPSGEGLTLAPDDNRWHVFADRAAHVCHLAAGNDEPFPAEVGESLLIAIQVDLKRLFASAKRLAQLGQTSEIPDDRASGRHISRILSELLYQLIDDAAGCRVG